MIETRIKYTLLYINVYPFIPLLTAAEEPGAADKSGFSREKAP